MGNKYKKIIETNIQTIREELGYTQKEMGEKLGVTEKQIENYEYFKTNLPIESAIYLSKKYNYTLDWIYRNSDSSKKQNTTNNNESTFSKYIVDIRDFISYSNGMIHFTIPNYYWNYIKERNSIMSSNHSHFEQIREIAKLEANYKAKIPHGHCLCFSIPDSEFNSFVHLNNDFVPYADSEPQKVVEPTQKEIEEFQSFLEGLSK